MKLENSILAASAVLLSAFILHYSGTRFPAEVYAQPACVVRADASKPAVLNWQDNSFDEDSFRIERKLNNGAYSPLPGGTVGANIQNFSDSTIVQSSVDNTYTYRVFAQNSAGSSAPSNEACITISKRVTPPAAASGLVIQ